MKLHPEKKCHESKLLWLVKEEGEEEEEEEEEGGQCTV